MTGLATDTVGIIGEFAAGGAIVGATLALMPGQVRKLRRHFGHDASPADPSEETTDAQLLGAAVWGAAAAGYGAALYLGTLHFLDTPIRRLAVAVFGFGTAAMAAMRLRREPLPGEPVPEDRAHLGAWLGFIAAALPLAGAVYEAYR